VSDVLEFVAKRAQKYVSLRPLIILGSGNSIPFGIPSMRGLATSLVASVQNTSPEWAALANELKNGKDLESALQTVPVQEPLLTEIVRATWVTIAAHDVLVLNGLLQGSIVLPLTGLFTHLLRTANPRICVITTNYDRLAEYAAEQVGQVPLCGFTPGHIGKFHPPISDVGKVLPRLSILKVHGSLDWFCDVNGRHVAKMNAESIPPNLHPSIVTPGVSKYEKSLSEPFRTILFQCDEALMAASSFLAIGFGFNDDHIQPKIHERVCVQGAPLVVLAETLTPSVHSRFINNPCEEFLFLEKHPVGTKVYAPEFRAGETISGSNLWALPEFIKLVTG
jgi:hypothetical protein